MLGNVEEINILKQLNHQHIAQMCGVYVLGADLYSLSYPVAEMDLDDYMRQGKHYDPTWVQSLIGGLGCLSRALAYAHSAGIKHKDIHAGNILVIGGMMILCDWGLSRFCLRIHDFVCTDRSEQNKYSTSPDIETEVERHTESYG
ncbi:kinase-like domain-containing protein [Leptodontidium sp. MPI-SDFR-AT-0119]|nr:kinase-like domain-containing protein [Leptodontidium sp. MPI-SDFR-AT-0119]